MFQINIYISFCMKDFNKAKLKRKLKENIFCKWFFWKIIFLRKFSTSMDWAICLLLKIDSIAYLSGNFGLQVRIVFTFNKSQMAEQGKNNKIHYRTVTLHLNIINKRTDFLHVKNVFKTVQELFNDLSLHKIGFSKDEKNAHE